MSAFAAMRWFAFHALRAAEAAGGPAGYRAAVWPLAAARACVDWRLARHWRTGFARLTGREATAATFLRARLRFHLTRMVNLLPDRLSSQRWRGRCRFQGKEHFEAARQEERPVILTTLHYGAMINHRYWLRAAGIPNATFMGARGAAQSSIQRHKDRLSPGDGPHVISDEHPRDAVRFLKGGGILVVLMDLNWSRTVEVDAGSHNWRISTTAFRLAAASGATVVPFLLYEEGPWRFVAHFGRPVPQALLRTPSGHGAAGASLWAEFQPILEARPEDCMPELLDAFRRGAEG